MVTNVRVAIGTVAIVAVLNSLAFAGQGQARSTRAAAPMRTAQAARPMPSARPAQVARPMPSPRSVQWSRPMPSPRPASPSNYSMPKTAAPMSRSMQPASNSKCSTSVGFGGSAGPVSLGVAFDTKTRRPDVTFGLSTPTGVSGGWSTSTSGDECATLGLSGGAGLKVGGQGALCQNRKTGERSVQTTGNVGIGAGVRGVDLGATIDVTRSCPLPPTNKTARPNATKYGPSASAKTSKPRR